MATLTPLRTSRPTSVSELGRWLRQVLDRPLTSYHLVLGATALLLIVGVMMVLSASSVNAYLKTGDSYYYVKRQLIFLGAGLVGIVVIAKLPPSMLRPLSWFGMALAALLLILTYTPLGISVNGNRNWLYLGSESFALQPAEFAKLAMIIWGADLLASKQRLLDRPKHLLVPFLPVTAILILLVLFQGDAGTAVVMAAIVVGMLWIVGAPVRVLAALGAAGVAGVIAIFVTSPVRMRRLAAFLDPTADLNGANDQANSGLFAIASGGWWGVGLGGSRQKWGSLPEAHTDFIFAVLGEEFGLFGSLVVLALFGVLGYAGVRIASRSDDPFSLHAAGGVTCWFMVQGLINLAVVLRLLPIAGVPLPLVSYGGSALIANLLAVGVLIGCARREPEARKVLRRKSGRPAPQMTTVVGSRAPGAGQVNPHAGSVVLAGGGSAGHTSPLIATASELRRLSPDVTLTALGTARGLETTVVPAAGLALELIPPVPMPRRLSMDLVLVGPRLLQAVSATVEILRRVKAGVLLGFGGYVSTPAYLAARRLGLPILIHEQNVLPGLANRLAARLTRHVYTSFPQTPLPRAVCIGLPLRRGITGLDRAAAGGCRARGLRTVAAPAHPAGQRRLAGRTEHQPGRARGPGPLARQRDLGAARARRPEHVRRDRAPGRPSDRGGVRPGALRGADGAGVRGRRPDAGPVRRQHRAGDGGGRPAGGLRALPARQRRAGPERRAGGQGRRRTAAGRRRLHAGWVATEIPALLHDDARLRGMADALAGVAPTDAATVLATKVLEVIG